MTRCINAALTTADIERRRLLTGMEEILRKQGELRVLKPAIILLRRERLPKRYG